MKRSLFYITCCLFTSIATCAVPDWRDLPPDPIPLDLFEITASDSEEFIWLRTTKCGSRTIVATLLEHFGEEVVNNDPHGRIWTPYDVDRFGSYFTFMFVRNPWDRIVSVYFDKVVNRFSKFKECWGMSFDEFVVWLGSVDLYQKNHHVHPLVRYIPDGVEPDFIGQMEHFNADLAALMRSFGIEIELVPRLNSTKHHHYSSYYTDETRDIIARVYAEDIERFGYEFEEE